jgi:hypothetical protein
MFGSNRWSTFLQEIETPYIHAYDDPDRRHREFAFTYELFKNHVAGVVSLVGFLLLIFSIPLIFFSDLYVYLYINIFSAICLVTGGIYKMRSSKSNNLHLARVNYEMQLINDFQLGRIVNEQHNRAVDAIKDDQPFCLILRSFSTEIINQTISLDRKQSYFKDFEYENAMQLLGINMNLVDNKIHDLVGGRINCVWIAANTVGVNIALTRNLARLHISNERWEEYVTILVKAAKAIVLVVDQPGEGILREVKIIAQQSRQHASIAFIDCENNRHLKQLVEIIGQNSLTRIDYATLAASIKDICCDLPVVDVQQIDELLPGFIENCISGKTTG